MGSLLCHCEVLSVLDEADYASYELTGRQELDGEIHCTVTFVPAFC
jgi:hypothetical protein